MQGNRLEKIVVATGVGRLRQQQQFDSSIYPEIIEGLETITGQKPSPRPARKSIAAFKLREGNIVGLKVTLRGKRMRDFFNKVVNVALPRVRDFRGIDPKQIDREGNLTIGFRDNTVFPEVSPEDTKRAFGFQVTLVSDAKDWDEAYDFYKSLGVPLQEKPEKATKKKK
ncbi:MAG: 50S ribosomal protein L5 [Candidatus Colwellbacteria bacterium CG10_big_fil_rev_8_21_14_0_10_41_28]|uniref:50S ribosomal protein L5 n=1 Tax=Candidatus Colwellbacteria bacterium CG10_big_fil_rev_8_21_14_0_10_41_28 TaxID=1974539 RepID=A0A2H0VH90_9BACT|nr:MAG: 50S ribosomal protein L5 [Candidatus Colwellbacteria bacterium CG10_big_fil_rev_8_21_14_0_10_41_28]